MNGYDEGIWGGEEARPPWQDLYSAGTGGSGESIMKFLFDTLMGQEREEFKDEGYNWEDWSEGMSDAPLFGGIDDMSTSSWEQFLAGEQRDYPSDDPRSELADMLSKMLDYGGLGGLTSDLRRDKGDVAAEISSEIGGIKGSYTGKRKGSRYGGLGTRTRGLGGTSRGKYMSDIYGLEQEQAEMFGSLQEGYGEDYFSNIKEWVSMFPPKDPTG